MADREYINKLISITELLDNEIDKFHCAYDITRKFWDSETEQRLWLSRCINHLMNDYDALDSAIRYYSFETTEVLYGNDLDTLKPSSENKKRIAKLVRAYDRPSSNIFTEIYDAEFIAIKNITKEEN